MITKVGPAQVPALKPLNAEAKKQPVSFGAEPNPPASESNSKLKKGTILAVAAIVLAIPVALTKMPVSKFKPLANLQEKLIEVMKKIKVKPFLDKVMGRTAAANTGINVVR